ncbi:MAG: DUF456 domain-containing protein [Planctomycetes bacterium]|nr:DUF456 domain-containing protein [Planctomycetota bacterium]
MWHQALEIAALVLICGLGSILCVFRLPGTWFIVAAGLVDQALRHWPKIWIIWVLIGVAVVAEFVEFATAGIVARRAGGSRASAWGGLIGGIAGVFIFSIPLPLIGSVIGALLGCFLGAAIVEVQIQQRLAHGARVGYFAAIGMAFGIVSKIAAAMLMSALLIGSVIFATGQ